MSDVKKITYVPYQQEGEPARRAAVAPVEFSLDNLTDTELQVVGHLCEAADFMNSIFRDQYEPATEIIRIVCEDLIEITEGNEQELVRNYMTMLDLQNSPYSLLPRKNHLLEIAPERLIELMKSLEYEDYEGMEEIVDLMTKGFETPDKANFYPQDMTEEELEGLEEAGKVVNSSVIRDADGELHVVLNEDRYAYTLVEVVNHLRAARDLTEDTGLRLYLDAKIVELETGSDESRRVADYMWVRHNSPVDIVISTALEVYLDNMKNFRGAASAGVYVRNNNADELLNALIEHVQYWEANAPWTYKRESIDPATLPKLKFVDVLAWSGDYVTGPFTTIAQSLPNDEWVGKQVGTVNMVYMNTGKAVHGVAGNLAAQEFLIKEEYEMVKDLLFDANQLHSALHEIGHTTGRQSPEANDQQPSNYLEEEYSFLEESRAELFGLFALKKLVEDGVISETKARACYDGMLITMVMSLKFDPVQAHNKARNGMFHIFEAEGIISRVEEDGKTRFVINHDIAHDGVANLLGRIGNIKAAGDKKAATEMREKNVFTDDIKAEIEKRTANFPLGRGLIFPKIKMEGDKFVRELEYPETLCDQPKFNLELLD